MKKKQKRKKNKKKRMPPQFKHIITENTMKNNTLILNIKELALLKTDPTEYHLQKSYSHKPHLQSLPHDRRTNDPELLQERIDEIDRRLEEHDEKVYWAEAEAKNLEFDKRELEQSNERIGKEIQKIDKEIDKENKNIETNKKDFGQSMLNEYATWKDYMEGLNKGVDDFIGIDPEEGLYWSDNHRKSVIRQAKELDKRVEDIMNIDYDKATQKDYDKLNRLGEDITDFMKDNYDHETDSLEANVWFPYGDIFNETPQYLQNSFDSQKKIEKHEKSKQGFQNTIDSNNKELIFLDEEIKQNQEYMEQIGNEAIDYIEEKKKCEAKMKQDG